MICGSQIRGAIDTDGRAGVMVQSWMRLGVLTVMIGILSCSRKAGEFVLVNHAPEAISNVSWPGSWSVTRLKQVFHVQEGGVALIAGLVLEAGMAGAATHAQLPAAEDALVFPGQHQQVLGNFRD
jgi:hypothetical protein